MYSYWSSIEFQQVPFIYTFKPFKYLLSVWIDIDYVDLSLLIWKVHQLHGLQFRLKKKKVKICIQSHFLNQGQGQPVHNPWFVILQYSSNSNQTPNTGWLALRVVVLFKGVPCVRFEKSHWTASHHRVVTLHEDTCVAWHTTVPSRHLGGNSERELKE